MMEEMIKGFPVQLEEAIKLVSTLRLDPLPQKISNVLICGMGGSGIGGEFIISFFRHESHVPILCNKSYDVPTWVDNDTLVIVSSYSGNTEETVEACQVAISRKAHVMMLSSGGKLKSLAEEHGCSFIEMPPGSKSPRACLGYSMVSLAKILIEMGIVNETAMDSFRAGMQLIKYDQDGIIEYALDIANRIYDKTIVIYSSDHLEPCAVRFRQQLNENSKLLCWHHVIPEMNHNELVGWKDPHHDTAVVLFRSRGEHKRVTHRIDFLEDAISPLTSEFIEILAKGNSIIERSIYLIHMGDWISLFLAQKRQIDPVEIRIIDRLKTELGNL